MEKYARQAVSEGVKNAEDLRVGGDSEIYRVLNLHYNRNNHIEVWGPQVRNTNTHTRCILFCFPGHSRIGPSGRACVSPREPPIDRSERVKLSMSVVTYRYRVFARLHFTRSRLCGSL